MISNPGKQPGLNSEKNDSKVRKVYTAEIGNGSEKCTFFTFNSAVTPNIPQFFSNLNMLLIIKF